MLTTIRSTTQRCMRMTLGIQQRTFVSPTAALGMADLPYHIVVGMPALSPTMETGSLAEWYVGVGDSVVAGDSFCKIETDKASIDFEAQDDATIAKILVAAGDGMDIPVGTPIMITVEEEADVAAFADYVHVMEETAVAAPVAAAPAPVVAAPAPVVAAPVVAVAPPAVATPAPVAVAVAPAVASAAAAAPTAAAGISTAWGNYAQTASPLAKTLRAQQAEYLKKYGTTGQLTL